MKKTLSILLLLLISSAVIAQKLTLDEFPTSDHLTVNGTIITVKNWGEKFDGDYDVAKLAIDSCVVGNCEKGEGRRVIAQIKNGSPRIRIMEGKFKNKTFLGEGVMLIDGYGKILDGTYEFEKFKAIYAHNQLEAKGIFHSKTTNENVKGVYTGYCDYGIGSATPEYQTFVINDFKPLYEGKEYVATTWKKDFYDPAYTKWLNAYLISPKFLAAKAANDAKYGIVSTNTTSASSTVSGGSLKVYCFQTTCSSSGKSFNVLSKISANIALHPFEEIKKEAVRMLSQNGWYASTATEYLGTFEEIHITGVAGKDYAVSESGFYEFKKN